MNEQRGYKNYCGLVLVIVFLLGGCASYEMGQVEKVPEAQVVLAKGKPTFVDGRLVRKRLLESSPELKEIAIMDRRYLYITRKWFDELHAYTDRYIRDRAPNLGSSGPALPGYAQTYSMLINSAANIAVAQRYHVKAAALIGLAVVRNEKAWGDIPADGKRHDYIVALTDEGGLILDLVTGKVGKLKEFPNRHAIDAVLF